MKSRCAALFLLILFVSAPSFISPKKVHAQAAPSYAAKEEQLIALLKQLITLLLEEIRMLQAELARTAAAKTPAPPIDAKAIVHLLCRYVPRGGATKELLIRGTGAIVHPEGYILTARHIIDPAWADASYPNDSNNALYKNLKDNYLLDGCDVGGPSSADLPTRDAIKTLNPSIPGAPAEYIAALALVPTQGAMSADEYASLDFGILKITERKNCASTPCLLPETFSHVRSSLAPLVPPNELVSYGYPVELGGFGTFSLKGAAGTFRQYFGGDAVFLNKPLTFGWIATDARQGRSGAPIFSRGMLVAIELGANEKNITENYGLAIGAIAETLGAAQKEYIIRTQ